MRMGLDIAQDLPVMTSRPAPVEKRPRQLVSGSAASRTSQIPPQQVITTKPVTPQPIAFEPADQARQRALGEVHVPGQIMHSHAAVRLCQIELLQHFEIAHGDVVAGRQFTIQDARQPVVAAHQLVPCTSEVIVTVVTVGGHVNTIADATAQYVKA